MCISTNAGTTDDKTLLEALTAAIEAKDTYTFHHSLHVSRYGAGLARTVGLDDCQVEIVRQAGLLHDMGKIGIPDAILHKSAPLSKEEYECIKEHVGITIRIIARLPSFKRLESCIFCHHERWDGKGFPRGIAGGDIPIEARCLTLADAFDAMTSDRPYRKAMSTQEAIAEIEKNKGTQFDPIIAQLFIDHIASNEISEHLNKTAD